MNPTRVIVTRLFHSYYLGMLVLLCLGLGVIGFGTYESTLGWNDMSRLGTVQAIVDQHVDWIDTSSIAAPSQDRVFINGHYYSHQPPVQAYLMAGLYQLFQKAFGLSASKNLSAFCYWMNFTSAGVAFILALLGMYQLALVCAVSVPVAMGSALSLGFGTIVLQYGRSVNSHIVLLAIAVWSIYLLERISERVKSDSQNGLAVRVFILGCLGGFAVTLDQALGGLFLLCLTLTLLSLSLPRRYAILFIGAILPWAIGYAILNWKISGSLLPIASKPEYFEYPGSPWRKEGLTGHYFRRSLLGHFNYGWLLVFSDRGIVSNNFPLWLALPAVFLLGSSIFKFKNEGKRLALLVSWVVLSVTTYTLLSSNVAGHCLSVRWFIPLLAVGYYVIVKAMGQYPELVYDFSLLTVFGMILSFGYEWKLGPWIPVPKDTLYLYMSMALLCWSGLRLVLWLKPQNTARRQAVFH